MQEGRLPKAVITSPKLMRVVSKIFGSTIDAAFVGPIEAH